MAGNPFTEHPRQVGETYGAHFVNAAGFGLDMLAGGLAALVHAVFPFLFVQTGSRMMARLQRRMDRRSPRAEQEQQQQ